MAALLPTEGKTQAWWPRPSLVPCDGADSSPVWNGGGGEVGGSLLLRYISLFLYLHGKHLKGRAGWGLCLGCVRSAVGCIVSAVVILSRVPDVPPVDESHSLINVM